MEVVQFLDGVGLRREGWEQRLLGVVLFEPQFLLFVLLLLLEPFHILLHYLGHLVAG